MENPLERSSRNDASPRVSVVIPCRNERDSIEECLRSLLGQEPPYGGFEVIVADGMSDDGTREILKRLGAENTRLRIVDNPGRIVSTGLNQAIKTATGTIIIRIDAHTEYAADYVRQCVDVLEETGADNVGGPWTPRATGYVGEAIAAAFQSPFVAGGARGHDAEYSGPVDTVYLGCWRREVFDRIGFFDEDLVRNQDDEFNLRLIRSGGRVWQSEHIRSWYKPRPSLRALFRQYMQYGYWKVAVIQKHKIPASVRHVVPGIFVFFLIALPPLAFLWTIAGWLWLLMVAMYTVCNLAASIVTASRSGLHLLPFLPLAFGAYHLGYGYGFLIGIWDFMIRKRKPSPAFVTLTRTSATGPSKEDHV
jgi:succinoglycan biosynthesis protein ExoA